MILICTASLYNWSVLEVMAPILNILSLPSRPSINQRYSSLSTSASYINYEIVDWIILTLLFPCMMRCVGLTASQHLIESQS